MLPHTEIFFMLMNQTYIWEERPSPFSPAGSSLYSYSKLSNDAYITLMYWWEYDITLLTSLSEKLITEMWHGANYKMKNKIWIWTLSHCKHPFSCSAAETKWRHKLKSKRSCVERRRLYSRWKRECQIGGEVGWQTCGCGEESHNHVELRNDTRAHREKKRGLSGRGASCELPATFMKSSSSSMLMKALIRQ